LLSGTAAIALSITQPASAVVINDLVAQQIDSANVYSNVVSLRLLNETQSGCTGSLIDSRTILTAAHCLYNDKTTGQPGQPINNLNGVSFRFDATGDPGNPVSGFKGNVIFRKQTTAAGTFPVTDDIAVISLAQPIPVTTLAPVRLLMLQPGQAGFPTIGTTITMVGYGAFGTGSNPPHCCWVPTIPGTPEPINIDASNDNRRRVGMSSLANYGPTSATQSFFVSEFRDPPQVRLEAGVAPGDSGGPLFAVIDGQLVQIGVARGAGVQVFYCGASPCSENNPNKTVTGSLFSFGYGSVSDWTPINLFLQWIQQNDPLRSVTAKAGNFTWSNPAAWNDSVPGVASGVPNNTLNYIDSEGDKVARYYNVKLSDAGTITLDLNPQIDRLSIEGAQSQLFIGAPYALEVLLGTTLSNGTLTMAGGTLATSQFMMSGGLLTGNGTIAGSPNFQGPCGNNVCVTVTGGTVAPFGTLNIQGNYTQTGGLLQFQLGPARANGTLAVTNTATLGGTSTLGVTVTPGLYALFTQYTLLTAGAISGTFAQFISSPPPSAFLSLSGPFYDATSVDVRVTRTPFGAVPGLSENQRAVGNALEGAYSTTLTGPAATLFTNLLMTGTPVSLSQLSGEVATGAQQPAFQLMNEFLGIMLDPFVDGRLSVGGLYGGATAFAPDRDPLPEDIALAYSKVLRTPVYKATPFEQRWSVWGAGFGGANRTSGDPLVVGSHDLSAQTAAGAAGLDYRVAPGTIVGFALAGGGTGWSLAQGLGTGSSDTFQAGVYAKTYSGPFYLAGALAYTQHWMSTDRVAFANDLLQARFDAESFGGRAEAGYRIPNTIAAITPYAAVQAQNFHTPTYRETDVTGGGFGLTYNAHDASDTRTELGARFDKPILLNWNAVLALRGRIAWAHDWITDPNLIPTFEVLPGANFLVQGATPAKNSALTSAGAELRLINGFSVLAKFDGEFAAHSQTYAGTGTVRYTW
jgi:outer membrane autotransporter protein